MAKRNTAPGKTSVVKRKASARNEPALKACFAALLLASPSGNLSQVWAGDDPGIPYPAALDAAAVTQDRLDDIVENSLIIGNGDINAVIYSEGGKLALRLTKNDVWDARLDTAGDPPMMKVDMKTGKCSKSGFPSASGRRPNPCPRVCAKLIFGIPAVTAAKSEPATSIASILNIRRAKADFKCRQPATVRALAQRNVFLVETQEQVKIVPVTAPYLPEPETGETEGIVWIRQTLPGDPDPNCWPGMTFVVAMATQGLYKAVAIVTSLESKEPFADAGRLARETLKEGYGCSVSAHEKIWDTFWAASGVEMEEKGLQSVWYRNLYFMRCVSKPGVEAVGLYAGLTTDRPQWHGAHTLDYNAQQTFWAWYACNHAELSEPYERMISRFLPRARWYARYTFDCGGICFPLNLFAHETADPEKCVCNNRRFAAPPGFSHFLAISGWTVQNLWMHYKFCPDRNYLEETAYPAIRDAAHFYIEIVTRCRKDSSGKALLGPTMSPEHHHFGEFNSTVDIAYIRYTLDAAIEAAGILKRDAGLADQCRAALAVLPDYPVAAGPEPMVTDVKGQEPIDFNFVVPVSPVYPAGTVNWFSPEAEKQLFTRTIKKVQWNGYNSAMLMAIAHARLSLPDTVAYMKQEFEGRLARPNGTLASLYFPDPKYKHGLDRVAHFTENFAAAGAVTELMLQSVGDIIRVFPAWPLERPARFTNLRAQGGFLVTSEAAQGKVQEIIVTSTVGGTLRLVSPWPTATVAARQLRSAAAPDKRGIITVETTAGERLVILAGG